ncbi:SHOCT domain-containing protein [Saccharopolyspora sp. MS10]|uniref:SHOCT domain-containing protein n=1 Tax=Saccharopolyspora sp. MS10 TaxID=3385973 RepID=UPI00399FB471
MIWIGLIALIIWAVVRLTQDSRSRRDGGSAHADAPEDILDRRFARGEIDAEDYRQRRAELTERRRSG